MLKPRDSDGDRHACIGTLHVDSQLYLELDSVSFLPRQMHVTPPYLSGKFCFKCAGAVDCVGVDL